MGKREKTVKIIYDAIDEINSINDLSIKKNNETRIFGGESELDSMGLVNLIVIIEEEINNSMNVQITLADEKAMSQKRSPFRTVETLADYIVVLLNDGNK